jgi:MFS family permease
LLLCLFASFASPVQSVLYCVANLPGNLAVFLLIGKVGRRPLLFGSMLSAAVFAVAFAFVASGPSTASDDERDNDDDDGSGGSKDKPNAFGVICAAMAFNAACTAAWDTINVVSTEVFPTRARATALGALAAGGRLASIAAQFVNGSLQSSVGSLLTVTACAMLVGALAVKGLTSDRSGALAKD